MEPRRLQQSQHYAQVRFRGKSQQQQQQQQHEQLTQGVGSQFEGTTMDTVDMSSGPGELRDNPQASSTLLRIALGRTAATDDARKSLLESDVVASLSPGYHK
ncbi:hypothetical protein F5Y05DRAFT_95119 [Hypoxylon sp. FL0543]|nr:hypothetical protein F5Y05DRAFT_95119 [Hypoxylon sp. FL0543]